MTKKKITRPRHQKKSKPSQFLRPLIILGIVILGTIIWYSLPRPKPVQIHFVGEANDTATVSASTLASANPSIAPQTTCSVKADTTVPTSGTWNITITTSVPVDTIIAHGYDDRGWQIAVKTYANSTGSGTNWNINIPQSDLGGYQGHMKADFYINDDSTANYCASALTTVSATASSPQKPAKPTGLQSNCYSGGTRATFRWDAVAGVTSYKFRLDQKNGTADKSVDNIAKTEYDTDLLAGQEYTWWVHSTKDGVDSDEARIDSLTCAKSSTATPTPTPTPKPTTKATPIPTPTPSIKPSPTPVSSTTNNLRSTAPLSSGSLNDIFGSGLPTESPAPTSEPNFFQKIALGWQAIFDQLAKIFQQ